ncbi:MAG: T9SS type A sorting domain-containing protein [bacterium]|nr:T9SS type A sorting domain-containing protein [bacterium]
MTKVVRVILCLLIGVASISRAITILEVNPTRVEAIAPNDSFIVKIRVCDVVGLHSWQTGLHFDPSVLKCAIIKNDSFLNQDGRTTWGMLASIDTTLGYAYGGDFLFPAEQRGVSGTGSLIQIKFKVKSAGSSLLNLTHRTLGRSKLLDTAGIYIPCILLDGWYGNQSKGSGSDLLICSLSEAQQFPELAWNGSEFLVVWQDYSSIWSWDIYGQRVSSAGGLVGFNFAITEVPWEEETSPALSWNGTNYLVVYSMKTSGDSISTYIIGVPVSATGEPGSKITISYIEHTFRKDPDIAWNGTNHLVVWEDYRNGNSNCDIYGQLVDAAGGLIGLNFVICGSQYSQSAPAVASDGIDYLVVWACSKDSKICGQRVGSDGNPIGPNFDIFLSTNPFCWYPDIAWNGTNYLVVWSDGDQDLDIYGRLVSQSGDVVGPSFPISTATDDQTSPKVVWEGSNFLVVWTDARSGMLSSIYGQRVSASGTLMGSNFIVSDNLYHQAFPGIAMGDSSLIVWSDFRNGTDYNIWANMVSLPVGVEESSKLKAQSSNLVIYPNPFSQKTSIQYTEYRKQGTGYRLMIYDLTGRLVKSFPQTQQLNNSINSITQVWDGTADNGDRLPSGIYFYKLQMDKESLTKQIVLVK